VGYGYGHGGYYGRPYRGHGGYGSVYYSPGYSYGYFPGYGSDYPYYGSSGYYGSGSGAASGLLLGALAGGIIGNNSGGHNGLRGAAWGAGAGLLLGAISDANRPVVAGDNAPVVYRTVPAQTPAAPQTSQPTTIINNYYNAPAPMSGANSLFGR
jgi:hypothetical protein